jgi:5-methylcytosine-specific restriction endonuclease McrA
MNILSPRAAQTRARREALKLRLGNRCQSCGNRASLEFDCVKPRGHWHHVAGSMQRIAFYEQEAEAGNLMLLCSHCHREKTRQDIAAAKGRVTARFWTWEI